MNIIFQKDGDTSSDIEWYQDGNATKVTSVNIVNEIIPKYTAFWFYKCTNLTSITGLKNINTKNATNMMCMFEGTALTTLDLSSFDTSKVTNMRGMFWSCTKLTSLNISSFNTSKVTNMFRNVW